MLRILSSEDLALNWHRIKPEVDKALAHGVGDCTSHSLFIDCMAARSQCWVLDDYKAIAITTICKYPTYSEIVVVTTTGDGWFEWGPDCLAVIEDFGKSMGCKYSTIYGRKGWARALPEGYKIPYQIYKKEITDAE